MPDGRSDITDRRRSTRSGRRRGVSIYLTAEQLAEAGYSPDEPAPWYRIHPGRSERRGHFVVTLYRSP